MGYCHGEKPLLLEKGIWPLHMIVPATLSSPSLPLPEDASQPHPNPAVLPVKGPSMTVFEIFKPAFGRLVDVLDDARQTLSAAARRFLSDRFPEFLQALLTRPSLTTLK